MGLSISTMENNIDGISPVNTFVYIKLVIYDIPKMNMRQCAATNSSGTLTPTQSLERADNESTSSTIRSVLSSGELHQ